MSNVAKNTAAHYLNFIVLGAVNFLVSPHLQTYLGASSFGIWKLTLRYMEFASSADGRATQALKWILAYKNGSNDGALKRRQIGAALTVWLRWIPILIVALAILIYAVPTTVRGISANDALTLRIACLILGVNIVLGALFGVPEAVLAGTNQAYRSVNLSTTFIVLSNASMLVAAFYGFGIISLACISLASTVTASALTAIVARRTVPWWGIEKPAPADSKIMGAFSGWTMVWALVQISLLSTEIVLIGALIGPISAAAYTFTAYASQFALSMCLLTVSATGPRLGALLGGGSPQAKETMAFVRETVLAIATLLASLILCLNRPFVSMWAGEKNFMGELVNLGLAAIFFQMALIRRDSQIQDIGLNIKTKTIVGLASSIAGYALGYIAFRATQNLPLMMLAIVIARVPMSVLMPLSVGRLFDAKIDDIRRLVSPIAVIAASFYAGKYITAGNWFGLVGWGGICFSIVGLYVFAFVLSKEARAAAFDLFRSIVTKLKARSS